MGIQALVVFIGLTIALLVGIVAGTLEAGARLAGWLAIGLVPVMGTVLHLAEEMIGREIWQYTAPYPYRSMQVATFAEASRLPTAAERKLRGVEAEDIRLAA